MSSERELLEAAARASGVEFGAKRAPSGSPALYLGPGPSGGWWNPLEDDGDALRLAVKLQLTICNEHVSAGAVYCIRGQNEVFPSVQSGTTEDGDVIPSDYPATRRAIVLAAAAIDAGAAKGRR